MKAPLLYIGLLLAFCACAALSAHLATRGQFVSATWTAANAAVLFAMLVITLVRGWRA